MNSLSVGDIYLNLNNWINNLKNEKNLLLYLESIIKYDNNNLSANDIQTILFKIKQLKKNLISVKKQIEEFSVIYNDYNIKNKDFDLEEIINQKIKILNEKYNNILFNNKSFIIKYPILIDFRKDFLANQLNDLSKRKINKENIKTLSLINFKIKSNSFANNKIKKINNFNNNKKGIKIDILKNKIKNIQINFEQPQLDTIDHNSTNFDNNNCITPSNKYYNDFKNNSFLKNETNLNLFNEISNSNSREKKIDLSKQQSFLKIEHQKNLSNNNFNIHNSTNNSRINLNIINHNHHEHKNNKKIIPNNYNNKNKDMEINKKLKINPIIEELKSKGIKRSKNKKTLNFPLKNILFEKTFQNKKKFRKLKPDIISKDKNNITISNQIVRNNIIKDYFKNLYSNQYSHQKRANSDFFLNPIKNNIIYSRTNNNSLNTTNINEHKLPDFSFDNINKIDLNKNNKIKRKKGKVNVRNRTFQIYNENYSLGIATIPNRIVTLDNNNNSKNKEFNNKIISDSDIIINIQKENKNLKKVVYELKKEIENIKLICQNLNKKVLTLEEKNEVLKKENSTILKLLNRNKKDI